MEHDKVVKMYIFNGDVSGLIYSEISNITLRAYKVPRNLINEFSNREDSNHTCVYILIGNNSNNETTAYVGEAEKAITRLKQHNKEDEYWSDAIVLLSKDNNFRCV